MDLGPKLVGRPQGLSIPPDTTGSDVFPDSPIGDPESLRTAVSAYLHEASLDLQETARCLRKAKEDLAADWNGIAASAYRNASGMLEQAARGAHLTLQDCADAVYGYSWALETAQNELAALRRGYDHARSNGDSGASYAHRARAVLSEFYEKQQHYIDTLNGAPNPDMTFGPLGGGVGQVGAGFGVPWTNPGGLDPHGLEPYNGVIATGDIPGWKNYKSVVNQGIQPTDDLTNAILLIAPAGGKVVETLGESALKGLAGGAEDLLDFVGRELGIGAAGRDAAEQVGQEARAKAIEAAEKKHVNPFDAEKIGKSAHSEAIRQFEEAQAAVRGKVAGSIVQLAKNLGAPVPDVSEEAVSEFAQHGSIYRAAARTYWYRLASSLLKAKSSAVRASGDLAMFFLKHTR